jgi:serine/threonine-protein kinase HipA
MTTPYRPTDSLHLWCLRDPAQPQPVGTLNLMLTGTRGVSLRYDASWLRSGFALSEDLPLQDMEHLPRDKNGATGAVDDARPDRWGERVIKLLQRPPRLSLLEMLYFAGDDRFGALGVSTSQHTYEPHRSGPLPQLGDANQVHELVRKVLAGEAVPEASRRLIAPGAHMGGARPKALINMQGAQWVLKFSEEAASDEPLVEHAAMTLAARAGITVARTQPVALTRGHAVAVQRFDRLEGQRLHALSAHVALRAAGSDMSYPALAQLLRRRGPTADHRNRQQMQELFRRLVFNILIDNTDDHEKNHVLLVTQAQHLLLAPAFDVLPTGHAMGYQSMEVGTQGADSSIDNALSMCGAYGLSLTQASEQASQVAQVVTDWREHFAACGVPGLLIDSYTQAIDRPALRVQRQRFGG